MNLKISWTNEINSKDIFFDKYQLIATSPTATYQKFLPSTEIESDSGYKYEFTDMTPGNYTVKIIPVISSAQAVPFEAQIEPIESLFPIFFYSPIFIAILSTVIVVLIIITGAVAFVCCCNKKAAHKKHNRNTCKLFNKSNEQIDQLEHSSLADCGDWNRTLAQTLIPDFQPLKETALLSNGSPYQPHRPQVHSNGSVNGGPPTHQTNQPTQPQLTSGRIPQPPPDIQSSHFTISPIKHELVHVDLLEGTDFKKINAYATIIKSAEGTHSTSARHGYNRQLPPPPPHPPHASAKYNSKRKADHVTTTHVNLHERILVHDSSASSASSMSDYTRRHIENHIDSLRRSPSNGPRYTQPQPANHGSDSSTGMSHYGVDQYSELDDGSINRYKTNHYYDIYEYKPYVDPSGYSKTQFSSSNDSYRQQHTSYSQVANGYSQDYAVLSPVNEV